LGGEEGWGGAGRGGVPQLPSPNRAMQLTTFWQSDGAQPHLLTLRFYKRETVLGVAMYLDFAQDESYTPKTISLRAGHILHNLRSVREVSLEDPVGWVWIPLWDADLEGPRPRPLRVHLLQLAITAMHQHGRDTHVRQVVVFGPVDPVAGIAGGTATSATSAPSAASARRTAPPLAELVPDEALKGGLGEAAIRL
jgi:Anaphase-promoting complex, subunit 10 (APC10)